MASISSDPNGRKRILFYDGNRKRVTVRLGKISKRQADSIKCRIEHLNSAKINSHAIDEETSRWLKTISDELYSKLANAGLAPFRDSALLGPFLENFVSSRNDKPNTIRNFHNSKKKLISFFGADKPLRDITAGQCDDWKLWLHGKYADATVSGAIKHGKQFFKSALRKNLINENPLQDVKRPNETNKSREYFVTRADAAKVLEACPDAEWRLIFALSRFGGLRCPSEHLALRWGDIDWEQSRMTVNASKTEHHKHGGVRVVPIFPELRPYLAKCFDLAADGSEFVIMRYRDKNANLRTHLERIIKRAGLKPWPRLFQNLRASRETELTSEFPLHVVCSWIGNSPRVANAHYLQTTDDHFQQAAKGGAKSGALVAESVENEAQFAAQQTATNCNDLPQTARQKKSEPPILSEIIDDSLCLPVPRPGFEPGMPR